jgi:hypothetical protein
VAGLPDNLADEFLDRCQAPTGVSRHRAELWEAVNLLTCVLHCWTKVQPRSGLAP